MKVKTCPQCGKHLQWVFCSECGGDGTQGMWWWKKPCSRCDGTGHIWQCPDDFQHHLDAIKAISEFGFSTRSHFPTMQNIRPSILKKPTTMEIPICPSCGRKAEFHTCVFCNGTGSIRVLVPGEWTDEDIRRNPFLPYGGGGSAVPPPREISKICEQCRGKGKVIYCPVCDKSRYFPFSRF